MTDWKRAGELADAHTIRNRLRQRYDYPAKRRARERAIKYLARFKPELALDFWSGGLGADAMVAAGLPVLSVDNFSQSKLTKERAARAIRICGEEGGYESHFGNAADVAWRADVGFLDFHGFLSKPMLTTLEACRHMKAAVVVALAARAPLGTGIGEAMWERMYRTAIEDAIGMKAEWSMTYRSPNDQPLIIIGLRQTGRLQTCANPECTNPVVGNHKSRYCWRMECKRRTHYLANVQGHRDRARRWRNDHPEYTRKRDTARAEARAAAKVVAVGTRKCLNCRETFVPYRAVSVFCRLPACQDAMRLDSGRKSNARRAAERTYQPRACRGCGEMFTPVRGNQRHHSAECRERHHRRRQEGYYRRRTEPVIRRCLHCDGEFEPSFTVRDYRRQRLYCSSVCRQLAYRRRLREGQIAPTLPLAA